MKNNLILTIVALSTMLFAGCSSEGAYRASNATQVNLTGNNYKIIQTGVLGKSYGFKLLGFIPIVSPMLSEAKANIWKSMNEPTAGRSIALANNTEDRSSLYLILFSIPCVTETADIVEFTGSANAPTSSATSAAPAPAPKAAQ
jgi:hypothetical protein